MTSDSAELSSQLRALRALRASVAVAAADWRIAAVLHHYVALDVALDAYAAGLRAFCGDAWPVGHHSDALQGLVTGDGGGEI